MESSEQKETHYSYNVLTQIPWVKTNKGFLTVKETLLRLRDKDFFLDEKVPGFEFGATFRFLMTIFPLIVLKTQDKNYRNITDDHISQVIDELSTYSLMFDEQNPFLQLPKSDFKVNPIPASSIHNVKVLYPNQILEPKKNFWNLEDYKKNKLSVEETILGLLTAYFYQPGGNTSIDDRDRRPKNGSSALRYTGNNVPAVEIISIGENLLETLALNTPKSFLVSNSDRRIVPHWADRKGDSQRSIDDFNPNPLWEFSWNSNVVYLEYDEEKNTIGVARGLIPYDWSDFIPKEPKEKWPKNWHDIRSTKDPLYFYYTNSKTEKKLKFFTLESEPYSFVAEWISNKFYDDLSNKIKRNLNQNTESIDNFIFLEHMTGGTAQSFDIRYSKIIKGYKEELLINTLPEDTQLLLIEATNKILIIHKLLSGLFTQNGTMKHLELKQKDVKKSFWGEIEKVYTSIISQELNKPVEIEDRIVQAAIISFEKHSQIRDLKNLDKHYKCLKRLRFAFYDKGV